MRARAGLASLVLGAAVSAAQAQVLRVAELNTEQQPRRPRHNAALDDAGDYFHEVHGGRMVHLFGLQEVRAVTGTSFADLVRLAGRLGRRGTPTRAAPTRLAGPAYPVNL